MIIDDEDTDTPEDAKIPPIIDLKYPDVFNVARIPLSQAEKNNYSMKDSNSVLNQAHATKIGK